MADEQNEREREREREREKQNMKMRKMISILSSLKEYISIYTIYSLSKTQIDHSKITTAHN